jgi:phosphate-selective porin OprO/OprP
LESGLSVPSGLPLNEKAFAWGAWEATARWSYVNLDKTIVPLAGSTPLPGKLNDATAGLNWYWNAYTKVQFNWIHAMLDNRARGDSKTDIFAGRFQLEFQGRPTVAR